MMQTKRFYIYYHKDPISQEIKYIGKGQGRRAYALTKRNGRHLQWIRSLNRKNLMPLIEIIEYFDDEKEALKKEEELIRLHKSTGKRLMNISENGTGLSGKLNGMYGRKRPEFAELGRKNKGKKYEEIFGEQRAKEIKEKISKTSIGENNPMYGKSGDLAPCYGRIGEKHPMYGKTQTLEARSKISESLKLSRGKKIIRSDGKQYSCLIDAAKDLDLKDQKEITKVLKGIRSDIKGFTFKYV